MATIQTTVCDRCGREIKYVGWTSFLRGFSSSYMRKFSIRKLRNGNPSGYNYSDWDFELCSKCTTELEKFMENPKGVTE